MAKIRMRKARTPEQGIPAPEVVQKQEESTSGGTVTVTVSAVDPDPVGLNEMQSSLAAMIRDMGQGPRGILRASRDPMAGLSLGARTGRVSAGPELQRMPALNVMVQGENAHRALEGLQQSADRLSASLGMSSNSARNMLESFARMSQPSRILTADDFSQLRHAGINIDLGEPGGDRTVYTNRQGQRLAASATELAEAREAESTLVEDPRVARLRRLMTQFNTKSNEAKRREGVEPNVPSYGGERLDPNPSSLSSLFDNPSGPGHIITVLGVVYWGRGHRRTCMMECEMDTRVENRGTETNLAVVAFNVANPGNFGIQPFCGSQQYNEVIGFFVYNASRGGSL